MTSEEEGQIITPKPRRVMPRQNILVDSAPSSAPPSQTASRVAKGTDKGKKIAPTNTAAVSAAQAPPPTTAAASAAPPPIPTPGPTPTSPNHIVVEGWEGPLCYGIDDPELANNICKAAETMDPSNRDILVLMLASIGGLTA